MNIYRLEDEAVKEAPLEFDTVTEFAKLDIDPEKREELIGQAFGNYIVTLGKSNESTNSCCCDDAFLSSLVQKAPVLRIENVRKTYDLLRDLIMMILQCLLKRTRGFSSSVDSIVCLFSHISGWLRLRWTCSDYERTPKCDCDDNDAYRSTRSRSRSVQSVCSSLISMILTI